jgi:hypothetical protein
MTEEACRRYRNAEPGEPANWDAKIHNDKCEGCPGLKFEGRAEPKAEAPPKPPASLAAKPLTQAAPPPPAGEPVQAQAPRPQNETKEKRVTMDNSMTDLYRLLFGQLTKLSDSSLTGDKLKEETVRSHAMTSVSSQILGCQSLRLKAYDMAKEYGSDEIYLSVNEPGRLEKYKALEGPKQ